MAMSIQEADMPYKDPNSPAAIESRRKAQTKYYETHRDKKRAASRAKYAENPIPHRERNRLWRGVMEKEKRCVNCGRERDREGKTFCSACWPLQQERSKRVHIAAKRKIFNHYGNGKCACCGETCLEFLSLDHIAGGGAIHRKEVGGGGIKMYYWLIANDFPEGYRVLCHNCNQAIGAYGYCPHERERLDGPGIPVSSP
jgi:hypothetical protein